MKNLVSSKVSCSSPDAEPLTEVLIPSDPEKTHKLYKIDAETCNCEITKQENNLQMFEVKNEVTREQNTHDVDTEPLSPVTSPVTSALPKCYLEHAEVTKSPITVFDIGRVVIDIRSGYQGELKSFERNSENKTVARFGNQVSSPEFLRVVT